MVKTSGFPGQDPTQATLCTVAMLPLFTTLTPDLAHGVQSPRESLSLSLPSALGGISLCTGNSSCLLVSEIPQFL